VINHVNTLMLKEAKEVIEKNSFKKKFSPTANEIIPMWIYVLLNAEIPSLLTECCILQDFKLKDFSLMSEADYNLANLINAVEQFKKDEIHGQGNKYTQITPSVISTKASIPDVSFDYSTRSHSMSTINSKQNSTNINVNNPKENTFLGNAISLLDHLKLNKK
jgi:hypothetical protein